MSKGTPRPRRRQGWRRRLRSASWIVPLCLLLVIALLPYFWILLTSFKPKDAIFVSPPSLFFEPVLDSYRSVFVNKGFGRYLLNSVIVGLSSTLVAVTIGVLAAYAIARHKVPGSNHLMFFILSTRLGPPVAFALPMYLIFYRLGMLDLGVAVVLAHASFNLVLVVWMMRSFFEDIPREVEEAAYLDGCSHFGVFFRISLRMAWPGVVTVAIFVLLFSWNELLFSLILSAGQWRTMTVMIPTLVVQTSTLWGEVAAACVIQSIPVILFTFMGQKHLVRGLTFGAVKG
jgi:multiple sugar transport system permease protein